MPTVSYFEPTPNPNAFKFHTGEQLLEEGKSLSFADEKEAERLPIAKALFDLGSVEAVLISGDFVSVSAVPSANWPEIKGAVEENLGSFDPAIAATVADDMATENKAAKEKAAENPLYQKVDELFEDFVRPALAGDGGGIDLVEVTDTTIKVRYQGACGSCPTSTASTMMAIENLVHDKISPELTIESV